MLRADIAVPEAAGLLPSQLHDLADIRAAPDHPRYLPNPNRLPAYFLCIACLVN